MTIENLQTICLSLPGVTQNIKWEDHLCFNVGDKMFLITSPDLTPPTASFKVTDDQFGELIEREGFSPAPYLARYNWVMVDDITRFSYDDWTNYATQAYQMIFDKLPRKVQLAINN